VPVDSGLDGADVLVNADIVDFKINPARDGRQTHMESKDLFDALPFQGREPTTTTMSRAAAKRPKRRMG
jgi:hypothetical protein